MTAVRMARLFDLSGRRALVTGGNSGIGEAMAPCAGAAGARVVLVARREAELHAAAQRLRADGIDAQWLAADLADRHAAPWRRGRPRRARRCRHPGQRRRRQPAPALRRGHARGLADAARAAPGRAVLPDAGAGPRHACAGWGRIINIASLQIGARLRQQRALRRRQGRRGAAHARHRAGLVGHGITCNAIGPGFFPTALTAPVFADAALARRHAEARPASAATAHWTTCTAPPCSCAARRQAYVTGQTLMVDGGYTAK
jgi:NAD(P)-dependent dehydrogenase (short-subunit alcohol dehydrogenase family)